MVWPKSNSEVKKGHFYTFKIKTLVFDEIVEIFPFHMKTESSNLLGKASYILNPSSKELLFIQAPLSNEHSKRTPCTVYICY